MIYYLIVSRLAPQKRLDIAVHAFNKLKLPLKIIGTGNQLEYLKSFANKNIEFLSYVPDQELKKYYLGCKAVIIPGVEDFNIVAVEAQSYGKPVIAFCRGGVTETVIDGKTGWFFENSLVEAIKKHVTIDPRDCIENAKKYSKERFQKEFLAYVRNS